MNEIKAVASKFEIPVIEDAVFRDSALTYFDIKPLNTSISEIGIFSFHLSRLSQLQVEVPLISSNYEYVKRLNFWIYSSGITCLL